MRYSPSVLVTLSLVAASAHADLAATGDVVRVEAANLTFGGVVESIDASVIRVRLESGVLAIPRELVTAVTVVKAAPVKPVISAPPTPDAPGMKGPRGPWLNRWGHAITLGVAGGSGGTHDTPIEARSAPRSIGGSLGYERSFPWVSVGGALSYQQMNETLVASGREGCPENAGGACFDFENGLTHSTRSTGAILYLKPYFMLGRVRVWASGGGEAVQVRYSYGSSKTTYGHGSTTAFGPRYGGGIDLATKGRRFVFTLGVDAGGAHYAEKIDRLFGAPWESDDAGGHGTDLRVETGIAITLGSRR